MGNLVVLWLGGADGRLERYYLLCYMHFSVFAALFCRGVGGGGLWCECWKGVGGRERLALESFQVEGGKGGGEVTRLIG